MLSRFAKSSSCEGKNDFGLEFTFDGLKTPLWLSFETPAVALLSVKVFMDAAAKIKNNHSNNGVNHSFEQQIQ